MPLKWINDENENCHFQKHEDKSLIWKEQCWGNAPEFYTQVSVFKDVHGYPVVNLRKILGGKGVKLTEGQLFSGNNINSIERFSTQYGNWEAKFSNLHFLTFKYETLNYKFYITCLSKKYL